MQLKNSPKTYGLVSVVLHWLIAIAVIGMFALGYWMVDLGYYHTWYHKAPSLHKSVGFVVFAVLILRVLWRLSNPAVQPLPNHSRWERLAAKMGHLLMYVIMFAIIASGYLISTADGVGIPVFGLFDVPASIQGLPGQADIAGVVHKYFAWGLMAIVFVHAIAALKHHWLDKDETLVRIFGKSARKSK